MWPCLLLKYCACDGVVSCQSTAPATGLSFWNIGPAALRDLLNTPRSPAAMLRQCEMDWSCHMLLYSVPQQHCRRVWGFCAARAKTIERKNAGSHVVEAMAATWCVLYFARDGTYRGTKICMCFEVKVPHGACVLILDCRLSWKQWISWQVIIASVFWFQLIQSWRVLYRFESPWALLCPRAITFLRPRPGLGQASVSLGAPRMPTNLLHHGPKNRAEKSAQNMAAIERPRQ